jgi:hypothetical protein
MHVCPECNGQGQKNQLSFITNPNGVKVSESNSFPEWDSNVGINRQYACTQCGGGGISYSFGV